MIVLLRQDDAWNEHVDFTKKLYFVAKSKISYEDSCIVYNSHKLFYPAEHRQNLCQSLNEISAFKLENHLQAIKTSIFNANTPVAQTAGRKLKVETHSAHHCTDSKMEKKCSVLFQDLVLSQWKIGVCKEKCGWKKIQMWSSIFFKSPAFLKIKIKIKTMTSIVLDLF